MTETVVVVRGRRVEHVDAALLRELAEGYQSVVIDLGTGDGRWLYRRARANPGELCLGLDANAAMVRAVSYHASRKPARGGLPNLCFVAAGVEALPTSMAVLADEVYVSYPWGSLLRAVLAPDASVLRSVARLLKPCGLLRVAVNASLLDDGAALAKAGLVPRPPERMRADAVRGYGEAGFHLTEWRHSVENVRSSWAGRLGQGRPVPTIVLEAEKRGDGIRLSSRRLACGGPKFTVSPVDEGLLKEDMDVAAVRSGLRTVDLGGESTTSEFTEGVIARVRERLR